ncbi:MAG: hypothetical protein IT345_15190 [Trueperaceae bacterium]|nr:hypothetical protein [Trueperaceae bacterium]
MTYLDTLDVGCAVCGSTYTINEKHECAGRNLWSLEEETLGYLRVRKPIQQARPSKASDYIDWQELLASFVVALLLTGALVAYFFVAAS